MTCEQLQHLVGYHIQNFGSTHIALIAIGNGAADESACTLPLDASIATIRSEPINTRSMPTPAQ